MRVRAAVLLAALAVPALGVAAHAGPSLYSQDVITKVSGQVTELRIDADISNITLTPGAASSVAAHLEWTMDKPQVTVAFDKGVLTVKARCNDRINAGAVYVSLISTCVDDLRVVVPADTSLVVATRGDLNAARFTGAADLRGGTVNVTDLRTPRLRISGTFGTTVRRVQASFGQITMSSGTIDADHLQGRSLTLSSGNGSIRASDVAAGSMNVSDSSGNVSLSRVKADTLDVSTGNGTVDVTDVRAGLTTLSSSSGAVRAARVTSERLDASTGNGNVTVTDVTVARSHVKSQSGNILIQRLRGDRVDANAGNGSLDVLDVHVRAVSADSSSGNVSVQDLDAPDTVVATSGNGSVNVRVPAGRYYVDARSSNGSVQVNGLTRDRRAVREITATSGSGNVTVSGV